MNMSPFDTLAYSQRLRGAGFSEEQAQAVVEVVTQAVEGGVATKADVHEVGLAVSGLRAEVKEEIAGLRGELYRALLMQTFAVAGIMFALLKLVD